MSSILFTNHFDVVVPEKPHVDRADGGHLILSPHVGVEDRTQLTREAAIDLVRLTMITGEAMKAVLTKHGVPVGRINYQDNGNWLPKFHVHLYGRALNAVRQPFGEALRLPRPETHPEWYSGLKPLMQHDIDAIREHVVHLLASEKYKDWI